MRAKFPHTSFILFLSRFPLVPQPSPTHQHTNTPIPLSLFSKHPSYQTQGDEARLLEEFPRVVRVFQSLQPGMRAVIQDITRRMGHGMADFVR